MKKIVYILSVLAAVFTACKSNQPSNYRGLPKEYQSAYQQIYGHCYDSLPDVAVVALDLYSDGLKLDKDKQIKGTGYNLYLSDIFVPDSLLEAGEYKSIPRDSLSSSTYSISSHSFLPGRDFEGYPTGMYILNIEKDKVINIQLLDSGSFVYRNDSLLFTLYYRNTYGGRATYRCTFHGELIPWLKR